MFDRLTQNHRDESGQALVLVLVISFLLLGFLTVAISSSRSSRLFFIKAMRRDFFLRGGKLQKKGLAARTV